MWFNSAILGSGTEFSPSIIRTRHSEHEATPPQIDLILTPLLGAILGEVFYSWGNAIENNGGKLIGSKALGKTATVLMNPAGALASKINNVFKYKMIRDANLSITNKKSCCLSARSVPGRERLPVSFVD